MHADNRRRRGIAAAGILLGLLLGGAFEAAAYDLQSCVRLAEKMPPQGLLEAQRWQESGGADAARTCRAAALFHSGDFAGAAKLYEDLAAGSESAERRAGFHSRAGWAWLRGGDAGRADRQYGKALQAQPEDPDLLIDRAFARMEDKRPAEAAADLTAAITRAPKRADAYLYRAAAWRAQGEFARGLADADYALRLHPGDGEALVLRGTLRALTGDGDGARIDWRDVMRKEPESANGRAAAANLARLDQAAKDPAKPKEGPKRP